MFLFLFLLQLYLKTMAHYRRELPGRVIDLRYEDLVRVLREVVVGRLKLKWEAAMLSGESSAHQLNIT